ncbi:hypothetical protein [Celeribacter halophilus]|uniref:hypothetical protein n=1 Tax=Celeribacter halophilus TaxID=576117 RepID=UPI003A949682
MDRAGREAGGDEGFHQPLGTMLGAGKDQRRVAAVPVEMRLQQAGLVRPLDEVHRLVDLLDRLPGRPRPGWDR